MSLKLEKYLSAEHGGGTIIVANRTKPFHWETFRVGFLFEFLIVIIIVSADNFFLIYIYFVAQLWRVNETMFNLRVSNKQFLRLEDENKLVADIDSPGNKETFEIVRNEDDPNMVRIRASNGLFLQVCTWIVWTFSP